MSVFHLKYRPQKFADLDLKEVSENLRKILQSKDMPQSFLFSGPKGAGKTSAARIVAKAINCSNLVEGEPCGECDSCVQIAKGGSVDIVEMDAASNRGIEDVRSLKDRVYLLPSSLKKKVFIVDEVHMMTKEAFNALLKLIEEPPQHTVFILCTTDEGKIPETVLSRLVKVGFYKGREEELLKSIERVELGESLKIDEAAKKMLVEMSDGSFRNLQKTLNELVLEFGKKITISEVEKYFQLRLGEYKMSDLEDDLGQGRLTKILTSFEKMAEGGVDFRIYREKLIDFFQNRLMEKYGVNNTKRSCLFDLEKWLNLLIVAGKAEKDCSVDQLPLQLAVIELLGADKVEVKKDEAEEVVAEPEKIVEEKIVIESQPVEGEISKETVLEHWGNLLQTIKPLNHSVEAFLRAAMPKKVEGKTVIIEVYYPFHKDKLEEQKNKVIVEKGMKIIFGRDLGFECVLSKTKKSLVIDNETPVESVSEVLVEEKKNEDGGDIYDVAKQIFG